MEYLSFLFLKYEESFARLHCIFAKRSRCFERLDLMRVKRSSFGYALSPL